VQDSLEAPAIDAWKGDVVGRALVVLARALSWFGGTVLIAMLGLSVVSVIGRKFFDSPVQGDFELVQLGCAISVACFLPWCQIEKGHVIVDFFTLKLSPRANIRLDAIGALLLGLCAALLAWRLALGTISVWSNQETTMILGAPMWLGYAPLVPAFALLAATGLYSAWIGWRR
jgi:TRAP-type C4-dicarboxylate transport system permease small subunit